MATPTNNTRKPRNPAQNLNRARGRAMEMEESFLDNVGENLGSAYDTAVESLQGVTTSVRGAFKPANIVPVAIGSFVVGVAAGIIGTILFPKVRDSQFVGTLGTKLSSAKDSVGEGLMSAKNSVGDTFNSAKDSVMKAVKEATGDVTAKAGNNGTINPSRLA